MDDEVELTRFQIEVAHIFFSLKASVGYVVAGGAGLLASELINRPTEDLDLFTHAPIESVTAARKRSSKPSAVAAGRSRSWSTSRSTRHRALRRP